MYKILVVGSANMDLDINMLRIPAAGEELVDDGGVGYVPGGKGATAATAIARLGASCVFCTKLGADLHGKKLYEYYKDLGMDTSAIVVDHNFPTGLSVVLIEANGTRRTVTYPGANAHLSGENITKAFESNPDAVYIGFEIPFDTVLTVARIASAKNIPIFIDAAPAKKEYPLESLPFVEVFSPNEAETLEYTGISPAGSESALRAALALFRRVKCRYIVIKQGARGAFVYNGKHFRAVPAFRPDHLVDPTAAGDAFTAAMMLEYLRTEDIYAATEYGVAAGAITVSRAGSASSIPTDEEVRAFLERRKGE